MYIYVSYKYIFFNSVKKSTCINEKVSYNIGYFNFARFVRAIMVQLLLEKLKLN